MEIFNTKALGNRQRWQRALISAAIGTVLCIIVCTALQTFLRINSSLFYLAAAFFLAWLIMETGHGVHKKFSILAVVCLLIVILVSDCFVYYFAVEQMLTGSFASNFSLIIRAVIFSYFDISLNNLLSLFILATAFSVAYTRSRIISFH